MEIVLAQEKWTLCGPLNEFASDGEFDLVREIIDVFLTDTEQKLTSLQSNTTPIDWVSIHGISHSLKGAAKQIGLYRLAEAAECLEHSSDQIGREPLRSLITNLNECWREAKLLIVEKRATLPGSEPATHTGAN